MAAELHLINGDRITGDIVKKDQVLYQIDPRPYQASLEVAKGALERYRGQKMLVDIQVARYKKLAAKGAASASPLKSPDPCSVREGRWACWSPTTARWPSGSESSVPWSR